MSADETCFRMALAMMAADPKSDLDRHQRAWVVEQLTRPGSLAERAKDAVLSRLLAWADARSPQLGTTLRQVLGLIETPVVPGASALALLAQYPGLAARDAAEALAQGETQ